MKKNHFVVALCILIIPLLTQTSLAQVSSSLNAVPLPVGSGARALGMGGAFIAVADDATAATWNPGGLTQLERPELSIVGSFLSTQMDFDPGNTGFSFDNEAVSRGDLNFASVVYLFKVFGKNLATSLNYQQKYDFYSKLDFGVPLELEPGLTENIDVDFESKGGVGALTPAIALQVLPKLSIGVAVNFYTDEFFGDNAWKETTKLSGIRPDGVDTSKEVKEFKNFQAVNVTAGMLLDVWEKEEKRLTFGAVYHSPYTADLDRVTDIQGISTFPDGDFTFSGHSRNHFKVDYPESIGAGFGFRYNDALSFSMDLTWTDWSAFQQEDEKGKKTRPLGFDVPTDRKIDDTYAIRGGTEYLIFRQKMIIPVRGGLFYDPRPSLDNPTDVYGVSVGSGITFKRFSIDGAYQFRWANDGNSDNLGIDARETSFDLTEHMFLASVIVYF